MTGAGRADGGLTVGGGTSETFNRDVKLVLSFVDVCGVLLEFCSRYPTIRLINVQN